MEHEVVTEPGREVQLREVISHLMTVLDPLAAWYLLTRSSFISTDLRAQGQAVDGPDDEVSSLGTTRSSISLRKIPEPPRWPNQRRDSRSGRDGADFQLKFAEHGRKACCHDPFPLTGIPSCPEPRSCSGNPNSTPQAPPQALPHQQPQGGWLVSARRVTLHTIGPASCLLRGAWCSLHQAH